MCQIKLNTFKQEANAEWHLGDKINRNLQEKEMIST